MFCAPLLADLAQVKAETNLEKRSKVALEQADRSLKDSRRAYDAGDLKQAIVMLEEMQQCVDLAEKSLRDTGKDPIKHPKHFKQAEIKTGDLLRRIDSFGQDMNAADRPMLDKVRATVQDVHDRLLEGVMVGKAK